MTTLQEILSNPREPGLRRGWSLDRRCAVFVALCREIQKLHAQGIFYLDLSPEKILVGANNQVTFIDQDPDQTHEARGVLPYSAPEQLHGEEKLDHKADLFALGAIFYEILSDGAPAFQGRSEESIELSIRRKEPAPIQDCPAKLWALCVKLLDKEKDNRPDTADQVADEIEAFSNPLGKPQSQTSSLIDAPLPSTPINGHQDAPKEPELLKIEPSLYDGREEFTKGGLGQILKARDTRLNRTVALKEILEKGGNPESRFMREVLLTARLQHPGIVPVYEAGRWPSGEPFYAMKLVSGKSLEQVIEEKNGTKDGAAPVEKNQRREALTRRLALLPNVIAIAETIAYAHNENVVHRDLKPANVLVGRFGETVVIDWGLAKDVRSTEPAAGEVYRVSQPEGETLVGEVVGTPAYMPPEQAEGKPVDKTADVYALGAILYHVLAGSPPYMGINSDDVLCKVKVGAPIDIEKEAIGAPKDLLAIVNKAMARKTEDRYQSAQEFAEQLKKFQAGQIVDTYQYSSMERLVLFWKKHPLGKAVVVATVSSLVLFAFVVVAYQNSRREQAATEEQRDLAKKRLADAVEVANQIIFEVDKSLVTIAGASDIRRKLLDQSNQLLERLLDGAEDDSNALRSSAASHLQRGDLAMTHDDLALATKEYQASLDITKKLVASNPNNAQYCHELAASYEKIGDVAVSSGSLSDAKAAYQESFNLMKSLVVTDPNNAQYRRALSVSYSNIGDVAVALGSLLEAKAAHEESLNLTKSLVVADPNNAQYRRELAASYKKIGDVSFSSGSLLEAKTAYEESLKLTKSLVAEDPKNAQYLRTLSLNYGRIGNLAVSLGSLSEAKSAHEESLKLTKSLVAEDPKNAMYRSDLATIYRKIGVRVGSIGSLSESKAAHEESLNLFKALVAEDPNNSQYRFDLAMSYRQIGNVALSIGSLSEAKAAFEEYLNLFKSLASKDPNNSQYRFDLAASYSKIGDVALSSGSLSEAKAAFEESFNLMKALVAADPNNTQYRRELVVSYSKIGDVALSSGSLSEAKAAFEESLNLAKSLVAEDPSNAQYRRALASGYSKIGDVTVSSGSLSEAKTAFEESFNLTKSLVAEDPSNAQYYRHLLFSHEKLTNISATTKERSIHVKAMEEILDSFDREHLFVEDAEIKKIREIVMPELKKKLKP